MLGFNFIKFDSTDYVMLYKNGKVKKEGRGLSFWYFAPSSSIVSVPLQSKDAQFLFKESTKDYQEVTLQGQVTYKVKDPLALSNSIDFTVDSKKSYTRKDHENLEVRILNEVQTASSAFVRSLSLKEALNKVKEVENLILAEVQKSKIFESLGLEIMRVNLLGLVPNPDMARALEAQTRESLQVEADKAIYERRNFAVEQERIIKESELNTEMAVEDKQRQIAEKQMETDVVKEENSRRLKEMGVETSISVEGKKTKLIDIKIENEKKEANMKEYTLNATLNPYKSLDWKTLLAINSGEMSAKDNIALAFRELAENADKIGNLNISPDLLNSIMSAKS